MQRADGRDSRADRDVVACVQAKWMNTEKEMTDEIVGGNVFEFTTEIANLVETKSTL